MKKQIILLAALLTAGFANAQTDVDMGKLFEGVEKSIDLNEPSTVKDGVIFIGDTRPAEKIVENKYRGMRVQRMRRHVLIDGKVRQYVNALSFRRAPQGASVDHAVDVNRVPRSCMIQVKPVSDGKLTFCAQTNKPEGNNLYVAVRNGNTFKNIATLKYAKNEAVTGKKDAPFTAQSVDYQYANGDEIWIYSDGGVNLFGLLFSGNIDTSFTGSDPVSVAKQISKAQKK